MYPQVSIIPIVNISALSLTKTSSLDLHFKSKILNQINQRFWHFFFLPQKTNTACLECCRVFAKNMSVSAAFRIKIGTGSDIVYFDELTDKENLFGSWVKKPLTGLADSVRLFEDLSGSAT